MEFITGKKINTRKSLIAPGNNATVLITFSIVEKHIITLVR